jgi:uncharacterized protein (TIGR03435 family)
MKNVEDPPNRWKSPFLSIIKATVLALPLAVGMLMDRPLQAQAPSTQSPAAQSKPAVPSWQMPDWQVAAGGKMEFDVASVKQNTAAPSRQTVNSNIPLGPQDMFTPTGGLLSATNFPLLQYMTFAYKLTIKQWETLQSALPKWATTERFDIQARAAGNPTKDQFRLMMQALLADRFKLAIHYETKQLPVFALVLDKPGKMGPHFQQHPADSPCSTAPPPGSGPPAMIAGGFPEICGAFLGGVSTTAPGRVRAGARNVPMSMIADSIGFGPTGIDRPVLDKTGLTGKFDITIEFTPEFNGPLPPGATFKPDDSGPTFLQALKEQLGLKLEPQTGPVGILVVDHVEPPSEN